MFKGETSKWDVTVTAMEHHWCLLMSDGLRAGVPMAMVVVEARGFASIAHAVSRI